MNVYLVASTGDVHAEAPGEAVEPALVEELRDRVRYLWCARSKRNEKPGEGLIPCWPG